MGVNDTAIFKLRLGGQPLITVGIPVLGVADGGQAKTNEQGGTFRTRLPVCSEDGWDCLRPLCWLPL